MGGKPWAAWLRVPQGGSPRVAAPCAELQHSQHGCGAGVTALCCRGATLPPSAAPCCWLFSARAKPS